MQGQISKGGDELNDKFRQNRRAIYVASHSHVCYKEVHKGCTRVRPVQGGVALEQPHFILNIPPPFGDPIYTYLKLENLLLTKRRTKNASI